MCARKKKRPSLDWITKHEEDLRFLFPAKPSILSLGVQTMLDLVRPAWKCRKDQKSRIEESKKGKFITFKIEGKVCGKLTRKKIWKSSKWAPNNLEDCKILRPCVSILILLFQVILVKWNEPYQKLASCDSSGIIFVWIKYEGRWSIELINDRNTRVTHFSWSHDGRMALICYQVKIS